jgi:hypothetical protein
MIFSEIEQFLGGVKIPKKGGKHVHLFLHDIVIIGSSFITRSSLLRMRLIRRACLVIAEFFIYMVLSWHFLQL